jgi:hypothetical protein
VWATHISRELLALYRVGQVKPETGEKCLNTELQSLNCLYRRGWTTHETHCYRHSFCLSLSFHFLAPGLKEDISNYGRWRVWEIELQVLAWKMEVLVSSPGFSGKHIDGQCVRPCRNADGRWVHSEVCIAELLKLLEHKLVSAWSIYNTFSFHSATVHIDTIESFIYPTDAQPDCSKNVKIYIKIYMRGTATCFGFSQPSSGSYCMCFAEVISTNNQLKYVVYRICLV